MTDRPAAERPLAGIALMIGACFLLAVQDGISRHLAAQSNVLTVVMLRYWVFAAVVLGLSWRRSGSPWAEGRSAHPWRQALRAALLVAEIWVSVLAFVRLGLVNSQAVFICYPLIVAALAGPVLGERASPRQWAAITLGAVGVLILLQPGRGVLSAQAALPLLSAGLFAVYAIATRAVGRRDSAATSFYWTGVVGAALATAVGLWAWAPLPLDQWGWMAALAAASLAAHFLLIQAYALARAQVVQPFAYFHLLFGAMIGITLFGEALRPAVALGALVIIAAGILALRAERP